MKKENLLFRFVDNTKKVVTDTSDIGWGFHDGLSEIYNEYYNA